ncbi:amino acid adenylation domain-containing protein [Actinophytocola sp.]|uniref:amino acid adenylation domain-containing protein n=1 Tax=Actinophytocola sp. TaxID=1872138 RepID=UPI003D6C4081
MTESYEFQASFAQERLWYLTQLEPDAALYNIVLCAPLRGPVDPDRFRRALGRLVARHETLRTALRFRDGTLYQLVSAELPVELATTDLSHVDPVARERALGELVDADAAAPITPDTAPLWRARLVRMGGDDWRFVFTIHHTVYDAASTTILLSELRELDAALVEERPARVPELPIQYADFAMWQRSRLADGSLDGQVEYWRAQLAGAPTELGLPLDRPRPARPGHDGGEYTETWPVELTERLGALARRDGTTLYMTLLAGLKALLVRNCGQDDIVVGSPVAGREVPELASLIGLFINLVVLRTDLSGDPTFHELLARVRSTVLDGLDHQDVPFEKLVELIRPDRDPSSSALHQVSFNLVPFGRDGGGGDGDGDGDRPARLRGVRGHRAALLDLEFDLVDEPDGLRVVVAYRRDLFDEPTVRRLVAGYRTLLTAAAADPDLPLSRLPLLDREERARILAASATPAMPDGAGTVHELVAEQVARMPDAVAVTTVDGRSLTYRELDRAANRLAQVLRERGVGAESRVGVCLPRDPDLVVALLAVLKAGGCYLPLDPVYPPERLGYMLADGETRLLVTTAELLADLPRPHPPTLLMETVPASDDAAPTEPVDPEQLAYVIYTSGSTGRPKGVMVPHRGVVLLLRHMISELGLAVGETFLFSSSPSFDVSVLELFGPLASGGSVLVVPDVATLAGPRLADAVRRGRVSTLQATPSVLETLLPELDAPIPRVLSGGERLTTSLARRLFAASGELWNVYGPTETTIWSTTYRVPGDVARMSIGRPIAGTAAYVLGPDHEPVPTGVPGELFVGGAGVTRGYWGRPGLTADRFVPDPFDTVPGGLMYRTGDLVRRLADGTLEYLGRGDRQVKLRGVRTELGEVEEALRAHPIVRRAVVMVRDDAPGGQGLVAYLRCDGDTPEPDGLREHLRRTLPDAMIPVAFVRVDDFPTLPNGKLNRSALPSPDAIGATGLTRRHVAPRTSVEATLRDFWAELLDRDRVGVEDDFHALGGHSLLAVRLLSRIRETYGVELPLRRTFELSTVADYARAVTEARGEGPGPVDIPRRVPPGVPAPVSDAQLRLWFIDRLDPGNPAYNLTWAYRLTGELDTEALTTAFRGLVERHEALRTTFPEQDGEPRLVVGKQARTALTVADLTGHGPEAVHQAVRDLARHRFDLADGPLVLARLLRVADREHVLVLSLHHCVTDRWSISILLGDLWGLYSGRALPELTVTAADYALWQRDEVARRRDELVGFWRRELTGLPDVLDLPADRPRPAVPSHRGERLRFRFDGELTAALHRLASAERATLYMVLATAVHALLARYTGRSDIAVGTPVSGRTHSAIEHVAGLFINTVVLRGDLSGDPSFAELLRRTRTRALDAFAHQDLPFDVLVDELGTPRVLSRNPLFQVLLAVQNTPPFPRPAAGLAMTELPVDAGVAQVDLDLLVEEQDGELHGVLQYATDLFDADRMARLVEHLRCLLTSACADPSSRRLSELPMVAPAERALVDGWNATARYYPDGLLHELVADVDGPAVGFDGSWLSYADLRARANRLAHRLRAEGVGTDDVVGVCLRRCPDLLPTLLGILTAGAAYLPLEPADPPERSRFMVDAAGARVVVTTAAEAGRFTSGVRVLDVAAPSIAAMPATAPAVRTSPDALAYVIFTSGSTGEPKGVGVSHRAIVNRLRWMQETFRLGRDDRVLQKTPYGFDVSVWELFWPLLAGAGVVLARPGAQRDADELAELIDRERVTTVHFVPSMLEAFLDVVTTKQRLSGPRRVICSGEALSPDVANRCHRLLPGAELHNLYGPTEAAVDVTWYRCVPDETSVPIGRPIANTWVEIVDPHGRPAPIGVPGELWIGGVQLARGYVDRPGLTAERFVSTGDGRRAYRTGDLARWRADGEIEYLGRLDDQVKIRGHRIEPGEVRARLAEQPEIRSAVVVARDDGAGQRLVAYLVLAPDADDGVDWRDRLRPRLPVHLIPAHFVRLAELPLTRNGKLDRAALPEPDERPPGTDAGAARRAPAGPAEETVAAAWRDVLGLREVRAEDNFFASGGDSIHSLKVIARLRAAGYRVELQQVFLHQTVAELASALVPEAESGADEPAYEPFGLLSPEDAARLAGSTGGQR